MVELRDGDQLDLLDSSIRTVGGAVVSTTLYVLSGVVYAAVTSPAATGRYFFLALVVALVLRPVRGVSQTLQKVGSERGESVAAYLGLTVGVALAYLALCTGVAVVGRGALARLTVFERSLLGPAALLAVTMALVTTVESLTGAAGYPSAVTWVGSAKSLLQLAALFVLDPVVATATDIVLVVVATRFVVYGVVAVFLGVVPTLPTRHELGRAWAFARWSVPDQVLDRFSYNMPVYVLGVVATPVAVGVYETADRFGDFGATIAWHLSSPLLTKVSGDDAAGADVRAYLDAAVTGGTGVTFVAFGYLLAAHDLVATAVFPSASGAFSTTVLVVGGVNLLRGFWTLASHAIEGIGEPSISFRTKLYGLALSVPVPVAFGAEFGAVAGAAGYAAMNFFVCAYVLHYARDTLGTSLVERRLAGTFCVGLVVTALVTTGATALLARLGVPPVPVAVVAVPVALASFGLSVASVSQRSRDTFGRAYALCAERTRRVIAR